LQEARRQLAALDDDTTPEGFAPPVTTADSDLEIFKEEGVDAEVASEAEEEHDFQA
jgi:hypothetical protein